MVVTHSGRETRTVPTTKVREWLLWFDERSTQDPRNTENRKLRNRLYAFCQGAGGPVSTSTDSGRDLSGIDWTRGEIAFASRPGFGRKTIDRLITRVVAVTNIRE
jgi:hypothetical protein